jgi:ubiquinone/menaquinone biosynthesis C-methylase UbiE
MNQTEKIKEIENFWNENLCGKHFIKSKFPSKAFFDEYSTFRYKKTHHLDTYIDWNNAKNKSVLEIGLGIGADGTRWAKNAKSYTGIDLTKEAVFATKKHFEILNLRGEIIQGNAEKMPFDENTFDIAYSHGVLHHTEKIDLALKEINRVLKPNGEFILMVYSKGSFNYWARIQLYFRTRLLFEILKNNFGIKSKNNWRLHYENFKKEGWTYISWKNFPHHCTDGPDCYIANIYSKKEIKSKLKTAGFKIYKMKKAHFPIGGKYPKLEQFIGSLMGFHQIIWAKST